MVWLTDDGVQAQPLPLQDPILQESARELLRAVLRPLPGFASRQHCWGLLALRLADIRPLVEPMSATRGDCSTALVELRGAT